jgi:hypothetical protein
MEGNVHIINSLDLFYEKPIIIAGECMIECLNIDKNYTPYKSIQYFFKWFKWTWFLLFKLLLF